MQDSHSNSKHPEINSDSQQSQISAVPQLLRPGQSSTQNIQKSFGQYVKVSGKSQKIDQEGILEQFKKNQQDQKRALKNIPKIMKKKKSHKNDQALSKKFDFGNIRKKWKAQIQENLDKFKEYLKQEKKTYNGKQKEYLLDFYKILLDGVYQLKDYSQSAFNDITSNQKKVIAPESDIFLYLKTVVESFDLAFRQAKFDGKINNIKVKWDPLIKNLRDQSNFETRRKVIRSKIKPNHLFQNDDDYLMSEEAKEKQRRRRQLILAQAAKNFEKPLESEQNQVSVESNQQNEIPEPIESITSLPSNTGADKKINQERQKLEEYKMQVGNQPLLRLKERINELLQGTSSYNRIMGDFITKFGNM